MLFFSLSFGVASFSIIIAAYQIHIYNNFQSKNKEMGFFHSIRHVIGQADLFYSSELLRYKSETQYKTFSGGIISISLVAMVITAFLNMITQTLNKTAISYALLQNKTNYPTSYNLIADSTHNFMFGIQIQPQDLSRTIDLVNGPRYFDISLLLYDLQYTVLQNISNIPLQQCTDAHWSTMPEVVANAHLYDYKKWLCPKIGQNFALQGSYTSPQLYQVIIFAGPCQNSTDPDRPCAPQQQIDQMFDKYQNFYFTVNYINTVINPSQTKYISYYLQGSDYVIFSKTQGSQAFVFVSDYTVTTDSSFWPFSTYSTEKGSVILNKAINHPYTASPENGYVFVVFAKSFNSLVYQRQVQKLTTVFSYIGGLIGAISAVLFFLKFYTKVSFQMNIAMKLFTQERKIEVTMKHIQSIKESQEKQSMKSKMRNFNFLSFFYLLAYKYLSFIGCKLNWKAAKFYQSYQQQVFDQLDITTLLKRIIALENCMSFMLESHQIQGLRYGKKMNCERARQLRQMLIEKEDQPIMSINKLQNQLKSTGNKVANEVNYQIIDSVVSPKSKHNCKSIEGSCFSFKLEKIENHSNFKDEKKNTDKVSFKLPTQNQENREQVLNQQTFDNLRALLSRSTKHSFDNKIWDNVRDQLKIRIQNRNDSESCQYLRQKEKKRCMRLDVSVQSNKDVESVKL